MKEKAVTFSYGDYDTFPLWYLQYVEERRMDVTNLTWMFLACDWHIELIKRFHPKVSFEFNVSITEKAYHENSKEPAIIGKIVDFSFFYNIRKKK